MTDPRQTSRDSATSARSKTFKDTHDHVYGRFGSEGPYWCGVCGKPKPTPPQPRQLVTLHGLGWLVQLIVGILTLWLIIRGNRP